MRTLLRRPGTVLAGAVIVLLVAWTLWPGLFTSADPLTGEPLNRLQAPGPAHLFGTDHLGRDVWGRVVHGTRESVGTAAFAVLIALVVGSAAGIVSGYVGGPVDAALSRGTDVLQAVPGLLLSIAVVAGLGFGPGKIAVAVGVAAVPTFFRVARGEVLRWRASDFVEAARLNGVGTAPILARHVFPHAFGPVAGLAILQFGTALLAVAALSFLGLGAPPPSPEWGLLVADGRSYLASAWWLTTLPGLVIAVAVLSVNTLANSTVRLTGSRRTP
ncbi:ABC transporter permease [Corynebacterium sp.]|uniref:ABC transporter permease n=1 Tax=Corynebacterium sp. TaxID=1720 RepID=UPI0025C12FCD|nr:ABC transporter permease [Corynebacterium sp.]